MKSIALKVVFAVWVILWMAFGLRELFVKSNMADYKILISRSAEGKRAYVTGDELYSFIEFCKVNTPEDSSYGIIGFENGAIEKRRVTYYLYPRVEAREPDFLFVYKSPGFKKNGYSDLKSTASGYILKRSAGK